MSYRRDSRSPRNSNSSYGGGVNRRQSFGGGGAVGGGMGMGAALSPWQGGIVPGGGSQLNIANPTRLLSDLSSRETLVAATNLLRMLQPQQDQFQAAGPPPSLLSLPVNHNLGNFSNNSRSTWNSFSERRRDRSDNRRRQPYNKSGSSRQDGKSRFGLGKPRFNSDKNNSPKHKRKESDKKVRGDDDKLNGKADDVKEKEDKESKRQEDDVKMETDENKKEDSSENKAADSGKFVGIPQKMLFCHVCQKTMWDATSFEKHLSGRSHQMMLDERESAYNLKVELLQHEQRAIEMQREMEIERFQRQGKKVFNNKRAYCKMCHLNFFGTLTAHRKREQHLKLKAFLHPKCHFCQKEFPDRLRMDEHRLTPKHLQILAEHRRNKVMNNTDKNDIDGNDSLDELDEEPLTAAKEKKLKIDLTDIPMTIDNYDSKTSIGDFLICEVSGSLCRVCDQFLHNQEEVGAHLRSFTHYKNYAALVNLKVQAEKDKDKKEKALKDGEEEEENDEGHSDDEKPQVEDNEGTWKRRKRGGAGKGKGGSDEEEDDEEEVVDEKSIVQVKLEEEEEEQEEEKTEVKVEKEVKEEKEEKEMEVEEEPKKKVPISPRRGRGGGTAIRGARARRGAK